MATHPPDLILRGGAVRYLSVPSRPKKTAVLLVVDDGKPVDKKESARRQFIFYSFMRHRSSQQLASLRDSDSGPRHLEPYGGEDGGRDVTVGLYVNTTSLSLSLSLSLSRWYSGPQSVAEIAEHHLLKTCSRQRISAAARLRPIK